MLIGTRTAVLRRECSRRANSSRVADRLPRPRDYSLACSDNWVNGQIDVDGRCVDATVSGSGQVTTAKRAGLFSRMFR